MENTVLILGAGFSKPYGYPSGPELLKAIKENHLSSSKSNERDLAMAIKHYAPQSIDRFLHQNPSFYKTGIQLITAEILRYEYQSFKEDIDMAEDVVGLILNTVDDPNNSHLDKIKIITFNYDRLLEWRIINRLNVRFNNDSNKVMEFFNKIHIEHIHGSLPALNDFPDIPYGLANRNAAERSYTFEQVKRWAIQDDSSIKTVFANSDTPTTKTIETIKWADRLFFLGFGFEDLNMKKLGFNDPEIHYYLEAKAIAATSFGLPPVDQKKVERQYPFLSGKLFDTKAIDLFKNHVSLLESKDDIAANLRQVLANCCEKYANQERPNLPSFGIAQKTRFTCPTCKQTNPIRYDKIDNNTWSIRIDHHDFLANTYSYN